MSSNDSNTQSKMVYKRPQIRGQMVVTFALDHRPKITRSSGPKVRSGCDTCKRRHLKCDESKPSCHRCLKWRGYCEGYSNLSPSRLTNTNNDLQLLVEPDSNTKVFKHDWEKVYFDNWQSLAANLGGEWFQLGLFSRTVPQLSHHEPILRYAAIAVGAIVNAKSRDGGELPAEMGTTNVHYNAAINYYGRAIRLLQNRSDPLDDTTIRTTLIASILFACFETLEGSYGTAANHVNHGLKILESFKKSNQVPYTKSLEQSSTLEDEILQILQRLDYQSWTVGLLDRWRQSSPPVYTSKSPGSSSSPGSNGSDMPKRFTSLPQARRWWDLVLYRSLQPGSDAPTDDHECSSRGSCFAASTPFPPTLTTAFSGICPDTDQDKVFQVQPPPSEKLAMLENWHQAFLPLYITARTNQKRDPTPYLQSISLLQQYHIAWICLRTGYFTDYMTLYSITPRFREIVRLAGILLSHASPASSSISSDSNKSAPDTSTSSINGNNINRYTSNQTEVAKFTLDNGPTLSLFLTSMKCRDRKVRIQALELLKKYPRRDAFWSSQAAAAIAEMNVQLEDANEDGGGTLEEQFSRLRMRDGVFVDRKRELHGRFFFRDESVERGWERRPVVIRW